MDGPGDCCGAIGRWPRMVLGGPLPEGPGACSRPVGGRTCGLLEDKMCASNHYRWRRYTQVATRGRGTLDLSPDICKTPNRRVAVTSPVTFAPGDTPPERAVNEGLRAGHDTNVGIVGECSRLDLRNFGVPPREGLAARTATGQKDCAAECE